MATPAKEPSSLITIPVPDAVTPVNPEPSPTNSAAVTTPEILVSPLTSSFAIGFIVPSPTFPFTR